MTVRCEPKRSVYFEVLLSLEDVVHKIAAFLQRCAFAKDGRMILHDLLHLQAKFSGRDRPVGMSNAIEVRNGSFAGVLKA